MPHAAQRLPISCGSSLGHVNTPSATGTLAISSPFVGVGVDCIAIGAVTTPRGAQLVLDDLAGRVHRQRVDELDEPRHLEVRHLARATTR